MRILLTASVCAISLFMTTSAARAGNLEQFKRVQSLFYHLNAQQFESISCRVESTLLYKTLDSIESSLAGKADVTNTLDSYSLVYSKPGGIDIHDPNMHIKVTGNTEVKDPFEMKLQKLDIKMAKSSFAVLVYEMDETIKQVIRMMGELTPPDLTKLNIEEVSNDAGVWTLRYRYKDVDTTEIISGNIVKRTATIKSKKGPIYMTSEDRNEKTANGKLLLRNATGYRKGLHEKMDFDYSFTYQSLKGVLFPKEVDVKGKMDVKVNVGTGERTWARPVNEKIRFSDCRLR